ncbi:DNA-binding transcriptional LysR family regulator [Rhizobium sp. PP-F2F-G38]|uniref:LysR family transcriptional regulator n=1 Tax=Ferranicluibacter rubi TaxID=2715133 RepID=A0AA43ZG94_9HYPH|nr:LysR substrate-binding domain-containing protein [Ferranicluibacter rubi]PYE34066.1 DNA-binding transcriptional LysR family regulator [Rhizobium sp. PP-WC-1G-195]PYE96702.1 DNA-binding transcriptional LysR family regulator [Rhizobium sp. PP-F2F-G38]TCP86114.1 DNA-binding transcriptional LysR family regulator [Rhizobium sp. PP-CC-2G-626]TCQ23613.1 DNA-binding transcriptional LysR family regulator [Rhizobium sp. PP-CC-3G-465]NHT77337.1 LysR family transcriptional regulator [Ferranicluibacter 
MDRLTGLGAFVRTADLGSFVAAGRVLGLSPSAVGKAVTRLESQLGVRLFQRSTRSLRLTEEGRAFHERCRHILDDLDDAQETLLRTRETPRGRVKVSAPIVAYHLLLPVLSEFLSLYPEIELDLDFTDRIVDLIDEGVDVAIRSGQLPDSRIMVRMLRPFRMLLCASPAYLEKCGTPACPRDLSTHVGIGFRYPNSGKIQDWPLMRPAGEPDVRIRHVLTCNNMEALRGAVLRGLGIGCMPDFLAAASLRNGELTPLLLDHLDAPGQFNLIWPSSRHLSPKVRVIVDFISKRLFSSECQLLPTLSDS